MDISSGNGSVMLMLRFLICGLMLCGVALLNAQARADDLAYAFSTRYAPYANWEAVLDVDLLATQTRSAYWRRADAIKAARTEGSLPLEGLHLALDPGHVGGRWAFYEGRDFVIREGDYRVREGELVLEVAWRVREALELLGAEVTLLRERDEPVNPKSPLEYLELAREQVTMPQKPTYASLLGYAVAVRNRAIRLSIVVGEVAERARLVNEVIQPDMLLSLHINAAPWPTVLVSECERKSGRASSLRLVKSNHVHVLIFGCLSDVELSSPRQQEQLVTKLLNGSGAEERMLGRAIGSALIDGTGLPASHYAGQNAIYLDREVPELWARNLMLLRMVECPIVLLEPYVANSEAVYPRLQDALAVRAQGGDLSEDDILVEYADAVVDGVLRMYGNSP